MTLLPEFSTVAPSNENVDVHVLIKIDAAPMPEEAQNGTRQAINLGLTLDTSGSMAEAAKWEYAKQATIEVINRLTPEDRLSLTTYNFQAEDRIAQDNLKNKRRLKNIVRKIIPIGGTNISAGLESTAAVLRFDNSEKIDRIVLMSDGLANEGVSSIRGMVGLVRRLTRQGITISAIGLGQDYDEAMLRAIAQAGNGNYYYVESPAQAPLIFDQEVRGLMMTVAEDMEINVVGTDDVTVNLMNELDTTDAGFELGLMRLDESFALMAKFTLPSAQIGQAAELGSIQLVYKDRESGSLVLLEETISVEVSNDGDVVQASMKPEVTVERTLIEAEAFEREAVRLAQLGDYEGARLSIQNGMDISLGGQISINDLDIDQSGFAGSDWEAGFAQLEAKQESLEMQSEIYSGDDLLGPVSVANGVSSYAAPQSFTTVRNAVNQSLFNASKGQRNALLISLGDQGFEVERLEQALIYSGADPSIANGVFEDNDKAALETFQSDNGLVADGIAGPRTLSLLGIF